MRIEKNTSYTSGSIILPTSKSLSNRALIIRELAGDFHIDDLSDSDDTQNLLKNLRSTSEMVDVGAAGTNMRFLISLYCIKGTKKTITGSERMLKRPIGKLVDALNQLGADIQFLENNGHPPITIHPKIPAGGSITIDGSESSQFISSLLMIAPLLQKGISVTIENETVSSSYIGMTIELMKYFGVTCETHGNTIRVVPQKYNTRDYTVEGDWSSAGFWYGWIAASEIGTSLMMENLTIESLQGDKKTAAYFTDLGVETTSLGKGIKIEKINSAKENLHFDLINEPDLFPALAFTCSTLQIKAEFRGLQTLNLKESKRINVTGEELEKTGALYEMTDRTFKITGYKNAPDRIEFKTHDDHRIAMASAIYCMSGHAVHIENTEVVSKSYPRYWQDLKNIRIANIY